MSIISKKYSAAFVAILVTFSSALPALAAPATTSPLPTTMSPTAATGTPTATATAGTPAATTTQAAAPVAATPPVAQGLYSVEAKGGKLYFIKNGVKVGSYAIQNSNITLAINSSGNLLVIFPNKNGGNSSVTLGDQRTVQFAGTYNSIVADKSLGGSVRLITDSLSNVSTITLNAPVETHFYGTVGTIHAQASADLNVEKNATVTRIRMVNANALLTANGTVKTVEKNSKSIVKGSGVLQTTALTNATSSGSGTSVARSKSGLITDNSKNNGTSSNNGTTTTTSGDLKLTATTIYADSGDELRSLTTDLEDNVRAYDRNSGKRVDGDVYWTGDDYKEVDNTGTYSFSFEADDGNYGEIRGKVKIVVDGDYDYNNNDSGGRAYKFEIDDADLDILKEDRRDYELEDAMSEDDISSYVTAYDKKTDDEIDGDYEWVKPNATLGTSASFRFRPDSSRYSNKTGTIHFTFKK